MALTASSHSDSKSSEQQQIVTSQREVKPTKPFEEHIPNPHQKRPPGLLPLLKRTPASLNWRLKYSLQVLRRESLGIGRRLQGRRLVHLFHFGKTGGTAIKAALEGFETAGNYELVLHDHGLWLDQIPMTERFAFVLRDPVTRFVSGFYSRLRQELPRHHNGPWFPEEEKAFARFQTPNQLALALSSTDDDLRTAAIEAMHGIRHIESPQWKWLRSLEYLRKRRSGIFFVGFQESLDQDFELFKSLLGLPGEIKLPHDEVAAHKTPSGMDKRLDLESISNIKTWYQRDYELIAYCKEIASEIRQAHGSVPS